MKLALLLGIALAAWYLYEPIPANFSSPWKLRAHCAAVKLALDVLWNLDTAGLYPLEQSMRSFFDNIFGEALPIPENFVVTDEVFDGVRVRVVRPRLKSADPEGYPALVYYHGGGWFFGSTYLFEPHMVDISRDLNVISVSVDYRLAPKYPFPIPLDDCVTATKYVLAHAEELGVNAGRVAIGGDSAGGNLAAAVALRIRDENFKPSPKLQLLIYPCLQALDFSLPSHVQNANGPLIKSHLMAASWSLYAVGSKNYTFAITSNTHTPPHVKERLSMSYYSHDNLPAEYMYEPYQKSNLRKGDPDIWKKIGPIIENPYFSPLSADVLKGLPKAFIYTARYDILRDEGYLYAKRLRDAGVEVSHTEAIDGFHGVWSERHYKEGKECFQCFSDYLAENL